MHSKSVLIFSGYMNWGENSVKLAKAFKKNGINVGTISWGEQSEKITNSQNLFIFLI